MSSVFVSVVRDMLAYFSLRTAHGRTRALVVFSVIAIAAVVGNRFDIQDQTPESTQQPPVVVVGTPASFSGETSLSIVGEVAAIDQVSLQAETSGRVTRVLVEIGDSVAPGAVVAELENSAQYAALLQAEGAYEAAVAGAAQSTVGIETAVAQRTAAQNSAIATYRESYTAVNSVLRTYVDQAISNPTEPRPALYINGGNATHDLLAQRVAIQDMMASWQERTTTLTPDANLVSELANAQAATRAVIELSDGITARLAADPDRYEDTRFAGLETTLIAQRGTLTAQLRALEAQDSALTQASAAVEQAQLAGGSEETSQANAQIKQALGALRAAQANYNKTIIRTPIAGVVNSVSVKAGDFVGNQAAIADIANNNALEISAFIGESDRERVTVGQTVLIDNTIEGVVSAIAPAINPTTRKIEIKIQSDSERLKNGDTVTIRLAGQNAESDSDADVTAPIIVPITAVKFTATAGNVFVVTDDTLEAVPVELGNISGAYIEITHGITNNTEIVLDARGLSAGRTVEPIRE